jgi:hypothetical protein
MAANFQVIHEVTDNLGDSALCLQWGILHFGRGSPSEPGYRFIWRDPQDHQKPFRGQARIPSAASMFRLIQRAIEAGWFITCEMTQ